MLDNIRCAVKLVGQVLPKSNSNVSTSSAIQQHKIQLLKLKCWCHLQKHIFLITSI